MRRMLSGLGEDEGGTVLRGLAAYGSAELLLRVARFVAIIVIARRVSPEAVGAAALALSLFEMVRVLAGAGIGQRIVAAPAGLLDATCNTAHWLFWRWCGAIAVIQLAVAGVMAMTRPDVAMMLAVLSAVYLTMPGGLVQVFLLMRESRLGETARIGASQTLADHLLTVALVVVWPDPGSLAFAIVLPKLLTTPVWLVQMRRARPWTANTAAGHVPVIGFVRYGRGVLVTELTNAARLQVDKLIVGALLGVKALGLYYFAFNAGLGITSSFVTAFGTVLFPYLCRAGGQVARLARFRRGLTLGLGLFGPVTAAQVLLAPVYVPLMFGAKWTGVAPLVSILGLAALPMIAAAATTAWLRAEGRTDLDAMASSAATIAALGGLAIGAGVGLHAAAACYVAGLAAVLLPFVAVTVSRAGTRTLPLHQEATA